ncbi:peptidase inhibitor family I36 [Flavimobilis soli]|uniref:Peptidase inhibitor family I36 n=1 Tax=Flavimobilis soli TaxID=442709 RepID=A0A2A9EFH4_9MICO|nr:cutinase family protein [Flavimobilis soli]PFG37674.1 peptidase inhibitor family I36 [Flavimobilis soli]
MRKLIRSAFVGEFALAAIGVAGAPAQAAGKEVTTACANVVVLGVRRSGEPTAASKNARALFGTRTTAVANKIKEGLGASTTIKFEGISYPAVSATDLKSYIGSGAKASNMDKSVAKGRDALIARIDHDKKSCAKSKLVIIGYSQGAWVAHDGIAKYGESAGKISNVAAIVLLADPANVGSKYQTVMVNSDGKVTGADTNRNGVCDAGEFCAYKDANLKNLVLEVAAPKGYKRIDVPDDQVSSVWNRNAPTLSWGRSCAVRGQRGRPR